MTKDDLVSKDTALKMAIDLLGEFENQYGKDDLLLPIGYYEKINACKEALKQPLTRDWKETIEERIDRDNEFKEALEQPALTDEKGRPMTYWGGLEQPAQEPVDVARVQEDGYVEWNPDLPDLPVGTKLYTHPHQWQGLTIEEKHQLTRDGAKYQLDDFQYIDFIE